MDTNVPINFQLPDEFPAKLTHLSPLHLTKKDFNVIWFSEQKIKMGAGGKEVASIEALPDKVNLLTQAPGKMVSSFIADTYIESCLK